MGAGGKNIRLPAISTDTTNPYTVMIPDITTGISDDRKPWVRTCEVRGSCLFDLHDQLRLKHPQSGNSSPGHCGAKRRGETAIQ